MVVMMARITYFGRPCQPQINMKVHNSAGLRVIDQWWNYLEETWQPVALMHIPANYPCWMKYISALR